MMAELKNSKKKPHTEKLKPFMPKQRLLNIMRKNIFLVLNAKKMLTNVKKVLLIFGILMTHLQSNTLKTVKLGI